MAVQNSQSENQNRLSVPNEKFLQVPQQNGSTQKEKLPENEETEVATTATLVVPLDGGWGWVVVAASFTCCLIVDGIVMSAGNFQETIMKEFNASQTQVTPVFTLLSGFYLIAGPFASALANRWGFRLVTIFGTIISAVCFAGSYFATGVEFLYVIYGILGGIGFSLIYIPSVTIVSYYFERWRALATGIAMCGSGVGTFIMAPLTTYLISSIGWRCTLVAEAAIIMICVLCGIVFRPLESVEVTLEDTKPEEKEKQLPAIFTKPLAEGRYAFSVPSSSHNTWIGAGSNTRYPTAAEVFRGSAANLDRRTSITPSATPTVNTTTQLNAGNLHSTTRKLEQFKAQQKQRNLSGTATPEENVNVNVNANGNVPVFNVHKELNTVGEDDENENETLLNGSTKPQLSARRHTVSGRRPIVQTGKKDGRPHALGSNNRPLYRDDIFFSGSLLRIPQYQSQSSLGYHMSVTRMPTKLDVQEEEEASCKLCPEAVRRTLATMLDMSLLKSPSFMLLATSGFLTMMGFFVPFLFIADRALNGGMDKQTASFIISVLGISNTIARILCGLLSSFNINALYLNNIAITVGGIATIFSGWSLSVGFQFTYAAVFGVAIACFSALRSIIAVELMGLEKLTNAFGILMLFQGIAAVMGGAIAASLKDLTNSFDCSFYFAGTLMTISALLCYPLTWVNQWEKQRAEQKVKTGSNP